MRIVITRTVLPSPAYNFTFDHDVRIACDLGVCDLGASDLDCSLSLSLSRELCGSGVLFSYSFVQLLFLQGLFANRWGVGRKPPVDVCVCGNFDTMTKGEGGELGHLEWLSAWRLEYIA